MGVTAMECNGICSICSNPCFRGEVKGNQENISPITSEEEKGASEAFDSARTTSSVGTLQNEPSETGLSVVENVGTFEVKTNIFGKQKVRKVK